MDKRFPERAWARETESLWSDRKTGEEKVGEKSKKSIKREKRRKRERQEKKNEKKRKKGKRRKEAQGAGNNTVRADYGSRVGQGKVGDPN